ncbi:MAG: shikimate dehydrogenase [Methylophilales bacterium]|nr:shikimate dehydrogenase [Methylophilales bacterium]
MTDKYAVIGNPIAHSKSPEIHMAFAQQTAQDISYERVLAPLQNFADTVKRLCDEGYQGCSVTVPFKFEAFQLGGQLTPRAQAAKAVNTLKFQGQNALGDNTDGVGLVTDIMRNLDCELQGKQVLLMGAGGAAYGAALPLKLAGAALTIVNRNLGRAQQLADTLPQGVQSRSYAALVGTQFDIVINATSSSLIDELPPLPERIFSSGALAYDMMYGRETPFMAFAREQGAAIIADGLGMLVEQAAEAFYVWRGVRPQTAPVIASLRK